MELELKNHKLEKKEEQLREKELYLKKLEEDLKSSKPGNETEKSKYGGMNITEKKGTPLSVKNIREMMKKHKNKSDPDPEGSSYHINVLIRPAVLMEWSVEDGK